MIQLLFFVFLVGGCRVSGSEDDNLQYGFCAGAKRPLYFEYINIQPWPLPLAPNQQLNILAHILLYQDITAGSRVKLDITKKTGGIEVDIPCLNTTYGPLGSCSYQGDVLTETLFHQFFCPDNAMDQPCSLPVLAGHYGQQYDDPYHVTLPNITLEMDWFLSGTFNIKATVVDDSGEEFTCLEFVVEVEEKNQPTSSPVTSPGPNTCQSCLNLMNRILEVLKEKDMLEQERDYLTLHACQESPNSADCQALIWEHWTQKISTCLFSTGWKLDQLTCLWYGQCQGYHQDWDCEQVMEKLDITLASEDIVPGARDHLQHCTGLQQMEEVTPYILRGLSNWIRDSTVWRICNGSVTTTTSSIILIAVLCTLLRDEI